MIVGSTTPHFCKHCCNSSLTVVPRSARNTLLLLSRKCILTAKKRTKRGTFKGKLELDVGKSFSIPQLAHLAFFRRIYCSNPLISPEMLMMKPLLRVSGRYISAQITSRTDISPFVFVTLWRRGAAADRESSRFGSLHRDS